jgi:hypothetical protein
MVTMDYNGVRAIKQYCYASDTEQFVESRIPLPRVGIGRTVVRNFFREEHAMKKNVVVTLIAVVVVLAVAWAAFGQAGGGGGQRGAAQREAQMKAVAAIQEQLGKLKALMEAPQGAQGRSFQDMSEEERTKMREEFTKRRDEQQKVMAAIQQQMDTLKGGRQLMTEHQQAMTPLKDLLASAQKENAKATAGMIEKLIAERQKQFDEKMAAMGITPDQLERMMQGGGQRRQQ